MTGFIDVYLPARIRAYPWTSSPRWSTTITQVSSAAEHRNQNWLNPLHSFKASQAVRCHEELEDLLEHWMVMKGPLFTFPLQDPLDFASAPGSKRTCRRRSPRPISCSGSAMTSPGSFSWSKNTSGAAPELHQADHHAGGRERC
jgi:hypothetical protein